MTNTFSTALSKILVSEEKFEFLRIDDHAAEGEKKRKILNLFYVTS
jgi:hypothetical protein